MESQEKHTRLNSAQISAAAQRTAVQRLAVPCPALRWSAVPCCAVLCRAVLCFLFVHIKRSMYVHACVIRVVFLEHGALDICKSPVCTEDVGPFTTSRFCHSVPFFLVSERSGRNRPLREAPCVYNYASIRRFPERRTTLHSP